MNNAKINAECNPYRLLACKIVEQAVLDWRALMRGQTAGGTSSLDEIKVFLLGPWCEELLGFTDDVSGAWVLQQLERETGKVKKPAARKTEKRPLTICGRTAPLKTWCNELGLSSTTGYRLYTTTRARVCGSEVYSHQGGTRPMIEQYMRRYQWAKEIDGKRLTPLWLMVTKDKYQLPLAVADSATELAKIVGVTPSTIIKSVTHKRKSRYIRIYVDLEEEE